MRRAAGCNARRGRAKSIIWERADAAPTRARLLGPGVGKGEGKAEGACLRVMGGRGWRTVRV